MKNEQLNALQNVKIYSAIDKRNGSHYNSFLEAPPSNVPGNITIDPTQYEKFGDFDSITAHELSHLKDKQQTQLKNSLQFANFGGDYESRFQDASKSQNFHDQSSEEYKADLNAARFLLKREGVYDFTKSPYPNMPEYIPDEDLDRMLKSMKEHPKLKVNGIIKRLLYLSKDDAALKEALRSYTDNFNPSTTMNAATGGKLKALNNYADGGQMDTQLSNESFQVKGNPNVTDGNYYPEYNANLDHNEVVKDQFVFSDKLKNPRTGKSFAAEAKVIETSIGRSQKALKINPNDQLAKNTIKFNEQRSQALASAQESLAQLKGLRSKDNVQNYAVGGVMGDPPYTIKADAQNDYFNPIDATTGRGRNPTSANTYTGFLPEKNQTLIDIGRDGMFYDPYRKEFAIRNSRGEYVPVEPTPGQFVQDAQGNIIDKKTNKSFAPQNQAAYDRAPKLLENRTTGADVSADYNSFKSSTPSAYKSSALPSAQNIQNNELPAGVTPQTHTLTPTG